MITQSRWGSYKQMEIGLASEENFELRSTYHQTCLEDYEHFINSTSVPVSLDYFVRRCWNVVTTYDIMSVEKDDVIYSLHDLDDRYLSTNKVLDGLFLNETNTLVCQIYDFNSHCEAYLPAGMFYYKNIRYDIPKEIEKEMYTKCHQMKAVLITKTNQLPS